MLLAPRVRIFKLFLQACTCFSIIHSCSLTPKTEISSIMGSDTTPNGIRFQFTDRFNPIAKRQLEMKSSGLDGKDIDLDSVKGGKSAKKGQTATKRCELHQDSPQHSTSRFLSVTSIPEEDIDKYPRNCQVLWSRRYRWWHWLPIPCY